ncbi:MAG: glycine dehydrogenase [Osedax symbiont Rs1]|nr:MAG: glycine dehydrogenase [Osedax symbiont Rs1]
MISDWDHRYTRAEAYFPTAATKTSKFWSSMNRVDSVYGDRNFICSCPSIDVYRD